MKTITFATIVLSIIASQAAAAGFPEKKWDQVNPNGNSTGSTTSYSLSAGPITVEPVEPIFSPNR